MTRSHTIASFLLSMAVAACGGVATSDDGPDAGEDPGVDAGGPPVPALLSSSPADGAVGVADDVEVVLTFSEQMDPATVAAAFSAPALGEVQLHWNNEQTVLTITPQSPLAYAAGVGNDPEVVAANQYEVIIGSAATSIDGVGLGAGVSVSFSTLRRMATTLETDPALTRHVTAVGAIAGEGEDLQVGDTSGNVAIRGLITIDLSPLPETASVIESATLATRQIDVFGDPYTIDAEVTAYHVVFADLVAGFAAPPMSLAGPIAGVNTVVIEQDVTAKVQDDLVHRADRAGRSQYRLQFESDDNNDSNPDHALFSADLVELQLTYLSE